MEELLDKLFELGMCVEIFREGDRYLVFIWPDVNVDLKTDRKLVCSRYGSTVKRALEHALGYVQEQQGD